MADSGGSRSFFLDDDDDNAFFDDWRGGVPNPPQSRSSELRSPAAFPSNNLRTAAARSAAPVSVHRRGQGQNVSGGSSNSRNDLFKDDDHDDPDDADLALRRKLLPGLVPQGPPPSPFSDHDADEEWNQYHHNGGGGFDGTDPPPLTSPPSSFARKHCWDIFWLLVIVVVSVGVFFKADNLEGPGRPFCVWATISCLLWVFRPFDVDPAWTAIFTLVIVPLTNVSTFPVMWSGGAFGGVWLVVAALEMSGFLTDSSLGARLAFAVIDRMTNAGRPSKARFLIVLNLLGAVLAVVVPAPLARVVLARGVGRVLLNAMGEYNNVASRTAVHASLYLSATMCSFGVVTSSTSSIMVLTVADVHRLGLTWSLYALCMAPFLWAGTLAANTAAIWLVVGRRRDCLPFFSSNAHIDDGGFDTLLSPDRPEQELAWRDRKLATIYVLTLGLWATDWLTGIKPLYVVLIAVLLVYLPGVGPFQMDSFAIEARVPMTVLALQGLGTVMHEPALTAVADRVQSFFSGVFGATDSVPLTFVTAFLVIYLFVSIGGGALVVGVFGLALVSAAREAGIHPLMVLLLVPVAESATFMPWQLAAINAEHKRWRLPFRDFLYMRLIHAGLVVAVFLPLALLLWAAVLPEDSAIAAGSDSGSSVISSVDR